MRFSLKSKVNITLICLTVLLICIFIVTQAETHLRSRLVFTSMQAKLSAQILKNSLQRGSYEAPSVINPEKHLGSVLDSMKDSGYIKSGIIYSTEGIIKVSTNPDLLGARAGVSETSIIKSIANKKGGQHSVSHIDKRSRILKTYLPIFGSSRIVAYVGQLDFSLVNMRDAIKDIRLYILFTALVLIIAALFAGFILSKNVIRPISLLNEVAKEVASGNLDLRINIDTNDELEELADSFYILTEELKKAKTKKETTS